LLLRCSVGLSPNKKNPSISFEIDGYVFALVIEDQLATRNEFRFG